MTAVGLTIDTPAGTVSGLLLRPPDARWLYVLAHGAGAGMRHTFMEDMAAALAERAVATLRFHFPYVEQGRRRPDAPHVAQNAIRAAIAAAAARVPELPLAAGGKSYGGRMTSLAAADRPGLSGVRGLVFLGFPLHAPARPSTSRAAHLPRVSIPMLFVQGTRDTLADFGLMQDVVGPLELATLHVVDDADHGFAVPKRAGRARAEILGQMADAVAQWGSEWISQGDP